MEIGTIINQYKIISAIGKGGMGEVFLAQDTKLDRKVALKILPSEFAEDNERMSRFVREAKSASALNHPNIITIHEIGESDGTHFIVTEFIDGKTLNDYVKANPLNYRSALEIAIQVASALDEAHSAGIVHRDIKPDNVMIRSNGLAKILDFGIAKVTAASTSDEEAATAILAQTQAGMIIGTPNYMSPEQARGRDVDHQTDIFSFGVVFYEMLSGESPFKGETVSDVIAAVLTKEPKRLSDIPIELEEILNKALEKDKKNRYDTVKDLLTDLREAKEELSVQSRLAKTSSPNLSEAKTQILKAQTTAEAESQNSIAVLPFTNMSSDRENDYFCDGLAEELLSALAKIERLKVAARTSAFSFRDKNTGIREIGETLGVKTILEGSVRKSKDRVRIGVQLIAAADGYQLWSETFDREMNDVFEVQDEITIAVVDALKMKLFRAEKGDVLAHYTHSAKAYESYLRGRFFWNKRIGENLEKAIEQFRTAADIDADYALAYAGLADCYLLLPEYAGTSADEALSKAKAFAERAMALAPRLGEPHASLGMVYQKLRKWAKSEWEYQKAIELNPGNATAYQWYSSVLRDLGRTDEAALMIGRAQELDPLSIGVDINAAITAQIRGNYDASTRLANKVLELNPGNLAAYRILGRSELKQKRIAEAIAYFEKAAELSDRDNNILFDLGFAYGVAGKRDEATEIVNELEARYARTESGAGGIAAVYAGLGMKAEAFEWLENGFRSNEDIANIRWSFPYESLRDDPRYKDLLKRMNLTE